jgi:hypothetical protein
MAETPNKTLVIPKLPVFQDSLKGPLPKVEELRALDRALADWLEKTQFAIRQQFSSLSPYVPPLNASTKTVLADYSVQLADGTLLADATQRAFTLSLPAPSRTVNRMFIVKKVDSTANAVTVLVPTGLGLIDGVQITVLDAQWQVKRIQSDGNAYYIV